jgi:hypothetical protein
VSLFQCSLFAFQCCSSMFICNAYLQKFGSATLAKMQLQQTVLRDKALMDKWMVTERHPKAEWRTISQQTFCTTLKSSLCRWSTSDNTALRWFSTTYTVDTADSAAWAVSESRPASSLIVRSRAFKSLESWQISSSFTLKASYIKNKTQQQNYKKVMVC